MVKEHALSMRYRAVGLGNDGLTQAQVTKQLRTGPRTLKRWMTLDRRGETLDNLNGRRRKTAMSPVVNIVVARSALKRHQSTRTLERKLTANCDVASHLQAGRAPLFTALSATEVAETARTA